jgi:hypothetical protein
VDALHWVDGHFDLVPPPPLRLAVSRFRIGEAISEVVARSAGDATLPRIRWIGRDVDDIGLGGLECTNDGRAAILLSHTPEVYRQAAHANFNLMLSSIDDLSRHQ